MNLIKATALCAMLVAGPGLAVGLANGSFDDPPIQTANTGLVPSVEAPTPEPKQITVPMVVEAPAKPQRVAYRAPRTCETRNLELYGGKVRVCARPASPDPTKGRSTADLVRLTRP